MKITLYLLAVDGANGTDAEWFYTERERYWSILAHLFDEDSPQIERGLKYYDDRDYDLLNVLIEEAMEGSYFTYQTDDITVDVEKAEKA